MNDSSLTRRDIDLIRGKKPQSYYRDVVWNRTKIEMLVHHPIPEGHHEAISAWGWYNEQHSFTFPGDEGKVLQAHVYTRYDAVRLVLNGKIIGEENVSAQTKLMATFTINYQPGELKAIGLQNGKAVDSVMLQTAGTPARIRLVADRTQIKANRNDLSYITAEVLDAKGRLVPNAALPLHFSISGNGEIIAAGNANPMDAASFQKLQHNTFEGKCLVVVRPKENAGKIILKAEGEGIEKGEIVIDAK